MARKNTAGLRKPAETGRTDTADTPKTPVPSGEPRPAGAVRRFKAEDYMELTRSFRQVAEANAAVEKVVALAQQAVDLSRQQHQQAVARMKKAMDRHSLQQGQYAMDDDHCTLQLVQ